MKRIRIGIIGCGTIGTEIARACGTVLKDEVALSALCDADESRAKALAKELPHKPVILGIAELVKKVSLVVEAASADISGDVLKTAIKTKRDILVMSIGGLIGREGLLEEARRKGIRVFLPSGAICGIDGLKAASIGKITSVGLTTRKPPKALEGAPYIKEKKISLKDINGETVIFDGSAEDATKGFPQNINVCAALSLAGMGPERTRVKIITSPDYTKNIHEVEITGDFGRITTRTENVPSKANPKTSALAILSAIATLKGAVASVRIGT